MRYSNVARLQVAAKAMPDLQSDRVQRRGYNKGIITSPPQTKHAAEVIVKSSKGLRTKGRKSEPAHYITTLMFIMEESSGEQWWESCCSSLYFVLKLSRGEAEQTRVEFRSGLDLLWIQSDLTSTDQVDGSVPDPICNASD